MLFYIVFVKLKQGQIVGHISNNGVNMKFTYNPRIIKHLGTELITSDEVAIAELIKNSYDAKADTINLFFLDSITCLSNDLLKNELPVEIKEKITELSNENSIILLEDNGNGMTSAQLEKGFFEVGSDIKHNEKSLKELEASEDYENTGIILGDKGIGRLSAQRLAPILVLETTSETDNKIHLTEIIWDDFISSLDSEATQNTYDKSSENSYTRIWLISTQENKINFEKYYTEETSRDEDLFGAPIGSPYLKTYLTTDLQSTLTFLYSPFTSNKSLVDLKVYKNELLIPHSLQPEAFKLSEVEHEFSFVKGENEDGEEEFYLSMSMIIKPWYLERIHNSMVGSRDLWNDFRKPPEFYMELLEKFKSRYEAGLNEKISLSDLLDLPKNKLKGGEYIKEIAPIRGKVLSFKRNRKLLDTACKSALVNGFLSSDQKNVNLKKILDRYNGIKLYRNNFRIASLGNKDSDWLKLQQKRTVGQQFFRFELGNAIGHVTVNDPFQKYIRETSSREHITDTLPALALEKVLDYIFNDKFYEFNRNASLITKNIFEDENLLPEITSENLKNKTRDFEKQMDVLKSELGVVSKAFKAIKKDIAMDSPDKIERVKDILKSIEENIENSGKHIDDSSSGINSMKHTLDIVESEKQRIEIEAYNNYKLMANGLITEAITHELHSVISTYDDYDCKEEFHKLKESLIENEYFELNNKCLSPINQRFKGMHKKILEVDNYYNFLEKTFVKKGTKEELEEINLKKFTEEFMIQYGARLKNIDFIAENIENLQINAPKGTLVHLFYNLMNNAIYWIYERVRRSRNDLEFKINLNDSIVIKKVEDEKAFLFYDSGVGVIKKCEETLFLPFISGKKGNGRGMGLYIVKKMLESFDASIYLLEKRNVYGNKYIFKISFED